MKSTKLTPQLLIHVSEKKLIPTSSQQDRVERDTKNHVERSGKTNLLDEMM